MNNIEELALKIQELRKNIYDLIEKGADLVDDEVVTASRMLDALLNEYERMILKRKGKPNT